MDIETRLELLETRNALHDLISGYAQGFDNHDTVMLRDTFHKQAVLELDVFGVFDGIEAIIGAAEDFWAASPHMHHWMANPLFKIDADAGSAFAVTSLDCLCTYIETGQQQIGGYYEDSFERIDGRWWIMKRVFVMQFMAPVTDWKPTAGSEAALASA